MLAGALLVAQRVYMVAYSAGEAVSPGPFLGRGKVSPKPRSDGREDVVLHP